MKLKAIFFFIFSLAFLSFKKIQTNEGGFKIIKSDTAVIQNTKYVLTAYRNAEIAESYFTVKRNIDGKYKIILKDLDYSFKYDIGFKDANNDGFLDIYCYKKWQRHCYLFNPKIKNFIEVGEYDDVDTLKIKNSTVLYQNKYPLLFQIGGAKTMTVTKCGDDTMMGEVTSELFVINNDYKKISFASLDNFETFEKKNFDTIACGSEIIKCFVPPYIGKYGNYNIWNSGILFDSLFIKPNRAYLIGDTYSIDSNFIVNYWTKNYAKVLKYGKIFKVRRERKLLHYQ